MNFQLRYRLFHVCLLVSGLCLVVLYMIQSSKGTTLLKLSGINVAVEGELKPNAVIVMLVAPTRVAQAMLTLRNIEDRFNHRLKYPYVLLTEVTFSADIKRKIDWITEGRATFAELPQEMWDVPASLDKDKIEASLETIGFTTGYRSMCRFFSGFFWRHPAIEQYDWIWRLDTDIEFHCDVLYDPFVRMRSAKALYAFVQITEDALWLQPSLSKNVSAFLSSHAHLIPAGVNLAFSWHDVGKALRGEAESEDWKMKTFYNNWEISHRSLWSSEPYMSFFEYLDSTGGFFYERWGDAVIHSHGVSMSLRPDQVMQFEDMGYEHQRWPYDCPPLDRCTCIRDATMEKFDSQRNLWFNVSTEA